MAFPRHTAGYPSSMLSAVEHVISTGNPLEIPAPPGTSKDYLRLYFYNLKKALRLEKKTHLSEPWSVEIIPEGIRLVLKDSNPYAKAVESALAASKGEPPTPALPVPEFDADAALSRILGE